MARGHRRLVVGAVACSLALVGCTPGDQEPGNQEPGRFGAAVPGCRELVEPARTAIEALAGPLATRPPAEDFGAAADDVPGVLSSVLCTLGYRRDPGSPGMAGTDKVSRSVALSVHLQRGDGAVARAVSALRENFGSASGAAELSGIGEAAYSSVEQAGAVDGAQATVAFRVSNAVFTVRVLGGNVAKDRADPGLASELRDGAATIARTLAAHVDTVMPK